MDDSRKIDPIPEILFSEYLEEPFRNCTRCGETLEDMPGGYQLVKIIRSGETVMEYALCHPCATGMVEEYSDESRMKMESFFQNNFHPGLGLEGCAFCKKSEGLEESKEFTLAAACRGMAMVEGFRACAPCIEITQELISQATRDTWDRFVNENFPGVPADYLPRPSPAFI